MKRYALISPQAVRGQTVVSLKYHRNRLQTARNMSNLLGTFTFRIPTRIIFGVGVLEQVGVEAKSLGGTKILLVSDQTLHKAGYVERAVLHLERGGSQVETYTDVSPEPTLNEAIRIAEFARSRDYDLVVGLGGGSPMDMAKLASVARTNSGAVKDYVGVNKLVNRGAPKILIPTTAGTGSEVTPNAIVSLPEDEIKSGIVSPYLFADVALVDPQLTLTVPPKVTAATGFDALAHAIEANISKGANPVTDALSLRAIHLISKSLVAGYVDGSDLEARSDLALASTLAGMAIAGAGTCAGHAVAYAFAMKCKCPHGISTGLALPYIMEYNLPLRVEKLVNIALALGEKV